MPADEVIANYHDLWHVEYQLFLKFVASRDVAGRALSLVAA